MKTILLAIVICLQVGIADAQDALDLAWDWSPGASGYTSGPNGDIIYAIYMRTEEDADYAYDYPVLSEIDNCWWESDHYSCETTLNYSFDPDAVYSFVAVAYLSDSPTQRSLSSNEITYFPQAVDSDASIVEPGTNKEIKTASSGSGGGGCFLSSLFTNRDDSLYKR